MKELALDAGLNVTDFHRWCGFVDDEPTITILLLYQVGMYSDGEEVLNLLRIGGLDENCPTVTSSPLLW